MKSAKDLKSKIVKEHVKSTQFLQSWSLVGAYCSPGGQLWVWRPVIRLVHRALCIVLPESFWSRQYRQLSSTAMGRLHIALLPLALLLLLVNLPASSSAPQVNEMQGMVGGDSNQVYVKKNCREQWHQSCSYYGTFFSAAWCIAFQCFSNVFDLMVSSLLFTPSPPQPVADLLRRAWDFEVGLWR